MADIEGIARALSPKARKVGQHWRTDCPVHGGDNQTLYLKEGDNVELVGHCFSHGCSWKDISKELVDRGLYQYPQDSKQNFCQPTENDRFKADLLKALQEAEQEKPQEEQRKSPLWMLSAPQFAAYGDKLPPPEQVIGPFQTGSSGFIAAPGGSGKSMFTLGLAKALASGQSFAGWEIERPQKVYMVDVEMSDSGLYDRMLATGLTVEPNITLDTSGLRDRVDHERFKLGVGEHHNELMAFAHDADVVMIDNVSACLEPVRGGDLFSPETWQQVFELETWARKEGKLLIFLDHTNKAGALAGSLHKHRMADFVCLMERKSLIGEPWLEFLFWMDKCRYDASPADLIPRLIRFDRGRWTHSDPEEAHDALFMDVLEKTVSQKDAAEEMGVDVKTFRKKLRAFQTRLHVKQRARGD